MTTPALDTASSKRVRFQLTPMAMGPALVEATYVMTRERAMSQAGGIVNRLGNRGWDQQELAPEMDEWLSVAVIKVLNEDFKNKVFIWCTQYGQGWLETIRESNEDLLEYRYVDTVQEPDAPSMITDSIQESLLEKIDAAKDDILEAQREGLATIMAQLELMQPTDQSSTGSPTKRRRVNTRSATSANIEKMKKIDQALRQLLGDNSPLVKTFKELAGSVDTKLNDIQSELHGKLFWSKDEQENLRKESRSHGLSGIEYKLLDRNLQEMQDGDLSIANLAALSRLLVSTEQYTKLSQKFPFPLQCEEM
ncbi:unnamed protein product [Fusarium equiseti]|uniref:Uncharacterized protein n=1 Tax=Fusarium equiseti TaxID=61235 RepID=A0A8J2IZA3_FUSEQ|nr:unnamed protein product [Fusarium equiseti]